MAEEKIKNAKTLNDEILSTMDKLAELLLESNVYGFNMTRMMETKSGNKHTVRFTYDVDDRIYGRRYRYLNEDDSF